MVYSFAALGLRLLLFLGEPLHRFAKSSCFSLVNLVVGQIPEIVVHMGQVRKSQGKFRVHMNLRRFLPASDDFDARLLRAVSVRSGVWAPATVRASFSLESNARI